MCSMQLPQIDTWPQSCQRHPPTIHDLHNNTHNKGLDHIRDFSCQSLHQMEMSHEWWNLPLSTMHKTQFQANSFRAPTMPNLAHARPHLHPDICLIEACIPMIPSSLVHPTCNIKLYYIITFCRDKFLDMIIQFFGQMQLPCHWIDWAKLNYMWKNYSS